MRDSTHGGVVVCVTAPMGVSKVGCAQGPGPTRRPLPKTMWVRLRRPLHMCPVPWVRGPLPGQMWLGWRRPSAAKATELERL